MEALDIHSELEAIFQAEDSLHSIDFEKELIETAKNVIQDVSKKCNFEEISDLMDIYSIEKLDKGEEAPLTLHDIASYPKKESSVQQEKSCIIPLQDEIKELVSRQNMTRNEVASSSSLPLCSSHSSKEAPSQPSCSNNISIKISPSQYLQSDADRNKVARTQITSSFNKLKYLLGLDDRKCDRGTVLKRVQDEVNRLTMKERNLVLKKNLLWQEEVSLIKEIIRKLKVINEYKEKERRSTPLHSGRESSGNFVSNASYRRRAKGNDFYGFEAAELVGQKSKHLISPPSSDNGSYSYIDEVGHPSGRGSSLDNKRGKKRKSQSFVGFPSEDFEKNISADLTQENPISSNKRVRRADFVGFHSPIPSTTRNLNLLFSPFSSDSESDFDGIPIPGSKRRSSSRQKVSKRRKSCNFLGFSGQDRLANNSSCVEKKVTFPPKLSLERSKGMIDNSLKNPCFLMSSHNCMVPHFIYNRTANKYSFSTSKHSTTMSHPAPIKNTNARRDYRLPATDFVFSCKTRASQDKPIGPNHLLPPGVHPHTETTTVSHPKRDMSASTSDTSVNLPPYLRKTNKCTECGFESPLLGVFKRHQLSHKDSLVKPETVSTLKALSPPNHLQLPQGASKVSKPYTLYTGSKEIPPLKSSPYSVSRPPAEANVKNAAIGLHNGKRSYVDTLSIKPDGMFRGKNRKGCRVLKFPTSETATKHELPGNSSSNSLLMQTSKPKKKICRNNVSYKRRKSKKCPRTSVNSRKLPVTLLNSDFALLNTDSNLSMDLFNEKAPYNAKNCNFIGFPDKKTTQEKNFIGFPSLKPQSVSPLKILLNSTRLTVSVESSPNKRVLVKRKKKSRKR